jgi:DNA-binding SARP family transcriptional activator
MWFGQDRVAPYGAPVSALGILLLGSPRVERDGAAVTFDTRKAIALLAYLAVTGAVHSRDTLCGLLWPDQAQDSARGALRRTLSVLRSGIGGEALVADRAAVGLRREAVERLDVAELRAGVGSALHGHPPESPCPRCRQPLAALAALYRDDFLAGFSVRDSPEFDDWQAYQAAGLRQQLGSVLERLVGAHVAAGDPLAAVEPARRWLVLDPLAEPAHAALIRLYAWTGQRGAALSQYRECVRVLHEELGVPPLSSTTRWRKRSGRDGRSPPPGCRRRWCRRAPAPVPSSFRDCRWSGGRTSSA